ncbi:MAG: hypothetical protein COU69_01545 [Candidatus Pacebacteria bacterium CG10_big_fil_rev_8_21_14_0_10_56_10]|nr:MAG: hypothetical protein COU69_01545 [Candidatus Pacebacteria bacterium CG10_big_fil_rev_8_21_14_0_10_56_10]
MTSLSVVVNTKNAATSLEKALQSVKFADEIVVVDMKSDDGTVKIAKRYTDQIFSHRPLDYVEPARNFALSKANGDWILVIDADEEVPASLGKKIRQIITDDQAADCYYLPRQNIIFGQWIKHTGWWPDLVLRLFRAGHVEWLDEIHSVPITTGVVKELAAEPENAIVHHNYQSVDQYLDRMNRYSTVQARGELEVVKTKRVPEPIRFWQEFRAEWLRRLFAQRGVEDGAHGLALAMLQSCGEMAVELKKWQQFEFVPTQLSRSELSAELREFQRDLNYWLADWELRHSAASTAWWWRLRRKFKF